jgi:hypothetical protein
VFERVTDAFVALDHAWRYTYVNAKAGQIFGRRPEDLIGKHLWTVFPEGVGQPFHRAYQQALAEQTPIHLEDYYAPWDRWFENVIYPSPDGLSIYFHDITERKRAEAEVARLHEDLRRHAEELEQRVTERTAQLAARNQELKDFAYTVSHDLKAPLRGISGYASELDRKHRAGLSERACFCLKQIQSATTHLDRLIEDLLHYSRLDAEIPTRTEVDLRQLVATILGERDLVIQEQHVEVTVDLPPGRMLGWERGLLQVLTNLVDNALKYSRQAHPPRLRIAATALADAWRITVSDNGIGFDMRYHDRIFGLFNRLVRMEEYEGTGAGLAIVRKTLDKQGGRVWAESEPGQGATFFVEIPRSPDAGPAQETSAP